MAWSGEVVGRRKSVIKVVGDAKKDDVGTRMGKKRLEKI